MNNEDNKARYLDRLEDDFEIYRIAETFTKKENKRIAFNCLKRIKHKISMLDTDEERLEYAKTMDNVLDLEDISNFLSDEYKLKLLELNKMEKNDIYSNRIVDSIKDFEILKKALKYTTYNVVNIIKKFDEDKQLELIPHVADNSVICDLATLSSSDQFKIKCLKYTMNIFDKAKIISKLNYDNKIIYASKLFADVINKKDHKELMDIIDFPEEIYNALIQKQKNVSNSSSNKEFIELFNNLDGLGFKYNALSDFVIKDDNPETIDNLILEFIGLIDNEAYKTDLLLKVSEDKRVKYYDNNKLIEPSNIVKFILSLKNTDISRYYEEINEIFYEGYYEDLIKLNDVILNDMLDDKQNKVLSEYKNISRLSIKEHYINYIKEHYDSIDINDIEIISKLIFNVDTSNSEEMAKKADSFISSILNSKDPIQTFEKVEKIFIQNHLPYCAKVMLTFLTVHPDFESYGFKDIPGNHYVSSPVLNDINITRKKILILSDIIRCSLESNSLNFIQYLDKLEKGNELYLQFKNNPNIKLSNDDMIVLSEFRDNVYTLFDNFLLKNDIESTDNLFNDLNKVESIYDIKDKSISDLIVSKYLKIIGINSIKEARIYMNSCIARAQYKNIKRYQDNDYTISKGDFVKGFNIDFFEDQMFNGVLAKDYLGADMDTDMTAPDTDLSRIFKDTTGMSLREIISGKDNDSGMFGQGYIVIKDDPNLISVTKLSPNEEGSRLDKIDKTNMFSNKIEAFSNVQGFNISNSYGIRTGFASSKIAFIVFDEDGGRYLENLYKLALPMVMNNLYIPIVSKTKVDENNKPLVLFTYEDFISYREKMNGISYYGINDYKLSSNISNPYFNTIASEIDNSNEVIGNIKKQIIDLMQEAVNDEYKVITYINNKLNKDELQILDTGSTSRSTNIPYDGDFDFIIRINRELDINNSLKEKFKNKLISKFDVVNHGTNVNGDLKGLVIRIDNKEYMLDLSFVRKTNKISYSTEMCVNDRLDTIKRLHPEKYKEILSNIIFAKEYLKANECYKKGTYGQGGLGGIGVENFILQNGGSFYDAALDFVKNAYDQDGNLISFDDFKKKYFVWDFGENFYTGQKNSNSNNNYFLHDNFVSNNMTQSGYQKMCVSLKNFIEKYKTIDLDNLLISEEKETKQNRI